MRRLIIRSITRFALRSRRRQPAMLQRFALTEADSAWQMLQAMAATPDPTLQAKLFDNALEELDHAQLFRDLAASLTAQPAQPPTPRRQRIIGDDGNLAAFEAFHFVGEQEIAAEFNAYAEAAGPGAIGQTFRAIAADEEGHYEVAFAELVRAAGSRAAAQSLVARARLQRRLDRLSRAAHMPGNLVAAGLLSLIYYLAAPLLAPGSRRRLAAARPPPRSSG